LPETVPPLEGSEEQGVSSAPPEGPEETRAGTEPREGEGAAVPDVAAELERPEEAEWSEELEAPVAGETAEIPASPPPLPVPLPETSGEVPEPTTPFEDATPGVEGPDLAAPEVEPLDVAAAAVPDVPRPGMSARGYLGLFAVAALVAGGLGFVGLRYLRAPREPAQPRSDVARVEPPPKPRVQSTPARPTATTPAEPTPRSAPDAEAAAAAPTVTPAATPAPTVTPPEVRDEATPIPEAPEASDAPAAPEAEAAPEPTPEPADTGEAIARLLNQAELAGMGERWEDALTLYDEVLRLDSQNAEALRGKAQASAAREMARRSFQVSNTVVSVRDEAQPAERSGRIDFELTPVSPRAGDRYSARVYLTNDGEKEFQVSLVTITTRRDGVPTVRNLPITERLTPGARTFLEDVSDVWREDTRAWQLEVTVKTKRGDSFHNRVVWK
jgi:hypothetical protein